MLEWFPQIFFFCHLVCGEAPRHLCDVHEQCDSQATHYRSAANEITVLADKEMSMNELRSKKDMSIMKPRPFVSKSSRSLIYSALGFGSICGKIVPLNRYKRES